MRNNMIRGAVVASAVAGIVGAATVLFSALPASATTVHGAAASHNVIRQAGTPASVPGDKITIEVKTVNGSGCPNDSNNPNKTYSVVPSPDNTAFIVKYKTFRASAGAGTPATDSRVNCQLGILVHYPQGFSFAIAQAEYHGYASLQDGVTAYQRATYYFQGDANQTTVTHDFTGPFNDDWTRTDVTPVESLVWSPCGTERILNVNQSLHVQDTATGSTKVSTIAMFKTDDSVATLFHLSWKNC